MSASLRLFIVLAIALASISCAGERPAPPAWVGACGQLDIAELGEAEIVPQLVERVEPKIEARPALGVVLLEVILDSSGAVCDARIVKTLEPQLDKAALEAVSQWRFTPAQRDGNAVAARYFASVEYKRPGAPAEPEDYASPAHPPTNR
jgi:protein TonB